MTLKKLETGEIELEGQISAEILEQEFNKILGNTAKEVEISGFRKGKAPVKMVREKIGDAKLLDEAALHLIEAEYPKLVADSKVRPIGSPRVSVTKLALGNPLEFKVIVTPYPEFTLPNYNGLAKEVNNKALSKEDLEVSEKEIEAVLLEIRSTKLTAEERSEKKEPPLLTDEMAKEIGNFPNKEELMLRVKENLSKEKEMRAKDKKRAEMIDALLTETKIDVPEVLIQSELNRMFAQFAGDVERIGRKIEDYLKDINKTTDDLFKEWRVDAEKSAKLQLILNEIAKAEKIEPEAEKIKKESEHLLAHYKDADPEKVLVYVETVLSNDMVFTHLESQK